MNKKTKILIMHTQEIMAKLLSLILEKQNFLIISVQHESEALKQLNTETIDIVLFDMAQPNLKMFRVLEDICQHSTKPVIVLSTESKVEITRKILQAGASAHITKPFRSDSLLTEIANLLPTIHSSTVTQNTYIGKDTKFNHFIRQHIPWSRFRQFISFKYVCPFGA